MPGAVADALKRSGSRLRAELPAKVAVWLGLAIGICAPYFMLQRLALLPARTPPPSALDRWIAFDPGWIWAYLSLALLVPLAPALATRRDALRRYARGLCWLCLPCFAVFLLLPVAGPRPEQAAGHALYAWLVGVDRPTNSLPSLHAGLTVYSLLYAARVLRPALAGPARLALGALAWAWGLAILTSTLATKQHWALDLPPGVLLAFAAHALAWRSAAAQRAPAAPRERSATTSVHTPTPAASSDRY